MCNLRGELSEYTALRSRYDSQIKSGSSHRRQKQDGRVCVANDAPSCIKGARMKVRYRERDLYALASMQSLTTGT